ncbi:MAG TPA: DUF1295 domain-containing protein [Draconibacterium sp.]|nr:DUF1295 domain-containing protein [Draconibacterium sp.]
MLTLFLQASVLILLAVFLLWIVSVILTNASIVDIFWGFAFVLVNGFYFFSFDERHTRHLLVFILVTLWGLRLTFYLAWRNWGKGEDFRYREFRQKYGPKRYWWISFFQTFLLQGILVMLVSLPLLSVQFKTQNTGLNFFDYAGMALWLIGFVFETGGDFQLAHFKSNPRNKGKVLNTGFWRYTRHPNYFGDAAVWWGFALFSVAASGYWQIIGSLIMTLLLLKVSGVALLEKTLTETKPEYRDYVRKTRPFLPWFPKK